MATFKGTFLFNNPFVIGTVAHSQTGKKTPIIPAWIDPNNLFLDMILLKILFEI